MNTTTAAISVADARILVPNADRLRSEHNSFTANQLAISCADRRENCSETYQQVTLVVNDLMKSFTVVFGSHTFNTSAYILLAQEWTFVLASCSGSHSYEPRQKLATVKGGSYDDATILRVFAELLNA